MRDLLPSKPLVKRTVSLAALVCATLCLSACDSGTAKRVTWSPDGSRAMINGSDGWHLCDASGKMGDLLLDNGDEVAWMPDSQRLVVVTHDDVRGWEQLAKFIPAAEQQKIATTARKISSIVAARQRAQAKGGKGISQDEEKKEIEEIFKGLRADDLLVYLHDHDPKTLKQLLKDEGFENKDDTKPIGEAGASRTLEAAADVHVGAGKQAVGIFANIDTLRTCRVDGNKATMEDAIYQTRGDIESLRVAPDGHAFALVESNRDVGNDSDYQLTVVTTGGDTPYKDTRPISLSVDWDTTGKNVLCLVQKAESPGMASLQAIPVISADGKPVTEAKDVKYLAETVFNRYAGINCAKDGRIFFSSSRHVVPAAPDSQSNKQLLYMVDPARSAQVVSILPDCRQNDSGNEIQAFALSPDGNYAALLGEDGEVNVLNILTQAWVQAQNAAFGQEQRKKSCIVPQWRNNSQLCFAIPRDIKSTSKRAAEVVLWNLDDHKSATISADWPAAAAAFLDLAEKPASTSASGAVASP